MSIFAAPSFYNQADQNIFTGGNRFITQEQYRLGDPIQKNISFNPGIPSTTAANMLPTPLFIPRQGQDGDGGGISTTGFEEQSTTADDFGSGLKGDDPSMNMTEEEEDAINAFNNPQLSNLRGITTAGLMSFGFIDPITGFVSLALARNKAKKEAMARAKQAAIEADFQREARKGNKGADFTGGRFDGAGTKEEYDRDPTGFSGSNKDGGIIGYGGTSGTPKYQQFMYGGRVPYMMGGLTNLVDIYD